MSCKGNYKIDGYFDYMVPPLEGLWRQEGVKGIDYAHKERFNFISVIRLPDFVTGADFDWAVAEATRKKKTEFSAMRLTLPTHAIITRSIFANICFGSSRLIFAEDCSAIRGRRILADGKETANINALRIEKAHESKGHISKLVNLMEQYAVRSGYKKLTIGVEAKETRNLSIYLHWKYDELVHAETEDGSLVLYYAKNIN